jgi:hypothetical protein
MRLLTVAGASSEIVHDFRAQTVSSKAEMFAAVADLEVARILVAADIGALTSLKLSPGQQVLAAGGTQLAFAPGEDGIELTTDTIVRGLAIRTDPNRRALFNDDRVVTLGEARLESLSITGCVRLLVQGAGRAGRIVARCAGFSAKADGCCPFRRTEEPMEKVARGQRPDDIHVEMADRSWCQPRNAPPAFARDQWSSPDW